MTGEHAEQIAEMARIRNVISEKRMQAVQLKHQFRESVLIELQEVDQEINDMTQQLYATKEQLKRTWIRAPIGGIIHRVQHSYHWRGYRTWPGGDEHHSPGLQVRH